MSESQARAKSRSKPRNHAVQRAPANGPAPAPTAAQSTGAPLGAFYSAGPVLSLGAPVQRQVAIGKADDSYEREAANVAERVTAGKKLEPGDISKVEPGAIPQTMPIQKTEAKPEEKKPEPKPVQKAEEKKPEQKVEEKKPIQKAEAKPEEKKPEPKPVQKAEAKPEQKIEDKKPVQKAEAKPEEKKPEPKPVQKAEAKPEEKKPESKPIQKAEAKPAEKLAEQSPLQRQSMDEEEPVQTQPAAAGGASGTASMAAAAQQAIAGKGAGTPLNPVTRGALESNLGADFGHVRVHDDAPARQAARNLNARAFTHGDDIWLGPGASQSDLGLMAHEATHVVQQSGGIQRMIQRALAGAGAGNKPTLEGTTIIIPQLKIPDFKHKLLKKTTDVVIPKEVERPKGEDEQRAVWGKAVREKVKGSLPGAIGKYPGIVPDKGQKSGIREANEDKGKRYFFEIGGKQNYLIGTADELQEAFVFPRWDQQGQPKLLDADHKEEVQLGGDPSENNLHLLDASANRSSGVTIQKAISKTIKEAADKLRVETDDPEKKKIPQTSDAVRQNYTIKYKEIASSGTSPKGYDAKWDKSQVEAVVQPLGQLRAIGAQEAANKHLVGEPTRLIIYPLPGGGHPRQIENWDTTAKSKDKINNAANWIQGFSVKSIEYEPGGGGRMLGTVETKRMKRKGMDPKDVEWKLIELGGIAYTTYIEPGSLSASMNFAEFKLFSPIEFKTVTIDDARGLVARGKLLPSIPLFKKLDLDISFEGGDLWISKTFTKSDFDFPAPLKITEASLTLAVSPSAGYRVEGDVFLEIEKVGKGNISAVKDSEGFDLTGEFNFDSKLFDPASIKVAYSNSVFSGEGKLGIPPGKVRGIESAIITASFEGKKIAAKGTVKPSIPGIEQGDLSLDYSPEKGLTIGGSLQLKKDIPGISSGSVQAQVTQKPGEDRYIVKASGEAKPKIPGIDTTLSVTYDDGAFDINGTASYAKGMLSGSVTVGATNRPIGEDGKPGGVPAGKSDKITLYGGGSVTLKIAPWLQATAGIRLLPNGEVEVTGEIGLPKSLDIFPEKKLDKNIFTIGIDIPIVGVAVAGQRIGIFANISGGLDLGAGIGPGQLQELGLKVTYNPAHEDQTKIHGGAKLHIPAHAGLRLFVRGSLGVGIPIVSAQAGIEIGGQLGLEGALDAGVQVDWSPAKGLKLEAFAEIYAEPKLKFDITGFVLVQADLLITTIELYSKRWQLAAFEYGSGLRLGAKFPVKYEEGKPFDISLSDVQFQVPEIKPKEMLSDLVKKIA